MNCCIDCFRDAHIRATIERQSQIGNCDFCSSKGIAVCNVDITPNPVAEMIVNLVQSYSTSSSGNAKPLKLALRDDWDIFNAGT